MEIIRYVWTQFKSALMLLGLLDTKSLRCKTVDNALVQLRLMRINEYKRHGVSDDCLDDGKGGPLANAVYRIKTGKEYKLVKN